MAAVEIIEVWNDNLEQEFAKIREILEYFPYIAMGTEVPDDLLHPSEQPDNVLDYNYQKMKVNVDMLKLTKLGLTFSDENENLPTCGTDNYRVWQFNFQEFNTENGIAADQFGKLLMSSGAVMNSDSFWVTFHGGYGLGYLIRILSQKNLPESRLQFFDLIQIYFPMIYDIKHMAKFCNHHGDLDELAEILDVQRIGVGNQAGSDSLLTSRVFKKLKDAYFNGSIQKKYAGVLFGLGAVDA